MDDYEEKNNCHPLYLNKFGKFNYFLYICIVSNQLIQIKWETKQQQQ